MTSIEVGQASTKPKPRRKPILDKLELRPAGDKPLRRSRTGCLTCRKRKKKCPEQYDNGACLRCSSGGWKCIREEDLPFESKMRRSIDGLGRSPDGTGGSGAASASPEQLPPNPHQHQGLGQAVGSLLDLGSHQITAPAMPSATMDMTTEQDGLLDPTATIPMDDNFWTTQSLDALLGASLPNFDLSLYESFGQVDPNDPFRFSPAFQFPTDDTAMLIDKPQTPQASSSRTGSIQNPPIATQVEMTNEQAVLSDFYDQYLLPAWAITYPERARKAVIARYREITNAHHVTRLCRQAAAAVYLILLRRRYSHGVIWVGHWGSPLDYLPQKYMALQVDPETILRDATLLVRTPKDDHITMEAHFWALSDLHMAVGSFCESTRSYAIMEIAERLLSVTYGPQPEVDYLSLNGYLPFYMRAFVTIDLNRSISQRRRTFFKITDSAKLNNGLYLNDGSHDQWFGLPAGLVLCLSTLINLIAQLSESPDTRVSGAAFASSLAIEADLLNFRSPFAANDRNADRHPREWAGEMAVETEIWRNLGLLLLWRHVNNLSVLSPTVRDCIALLLSLLRSLQHLTVPRVKAENNVIDFWTLNYTMPIFLVGALLVNTEDRAWCKQSLQRLGAEKNLEDMVMALDATWAATDREGQVVDWFDECQRLDISVVFF